MGAPAISKAAIQRAIEATKATGLVITGVTIGKDSIHIQTSEKPVDSPQIDVQPLRPKQWSRK